MLLDLWMNLKSKNRCYIIEVLASADTLRCLQGPFLPCIETLSGGIKSSSRERITPGVPPFFFGEVFYQLLIDANFQKRHKQKHVHPNLFLCVEMETTSPWGQGPRLDCDGWPCCFFWDEARQMAFAFSGFPKLQLAASSWGCSHILCATMPFWYMGVSKN